MRKIDAKVLKNANNYLQIKYPYFIISKMLYNLPYPTYYTQSFFQVTKNPLGS